MLMADDDAEVRLQVRLDYRQFIDDLNSKIFLAIVIATIPRIPSQPTTIYRAG